MQYHALQALLIASRNADPSQIVHLREAYRVAREGYDSLPPGERTDRRDLLDEFAREISGLA